MKFARFILGTIKGLYDILATYLLVFIVPFALAAFGLHLAATVVAHFFECTTAEQMWGAMGRTVGVSDIYLRIGLMLPAHVILFLGLRRPVKAIQPHAEAVFNAVVNGFRKVTEHFPSLRTFSELGFSVIVTMLLIPFILQPTLVSGMKAGDWTERAANLLDGTASAELVDSVVGLYRKIYAEPVVVEGVAEAEVERALEQIQETGSTVPPVPGGREPLMDRWNPYIAAVANADPDQFAYIKSFMWVESAGRQFAVSHTGCSGLMQFCGGTAKSAPYRAVFGRGQVYNCGCRTKDCRVPRDVQRDLESGDPDSINRQKARFPCELTDARFDPKKAIMAGGLYVTKLRKAYGGNIYLMYIGYNSGPGIANSVYRSLGRNSNATIEQINVYLPAALAPHYGAGSSRRARSLVKTHLPKIKKAFDRYRAQGIPTTVTQTPADMPVPVAIPAPAPAPAAPAIKPKPKRKPKPKKPKPNPKPKAESKIEEPAKVEPVAPAPEAKPAKVEEPAKVEPVAPVDPAAPESKPESARPKVGPEATPKDAVPAKPEEGEVLAPKTEEKAVGDGAPEPAPKEDSPAMAEEKPKVESGEKPAPPK